MHPPPTPCTLYPLPCMGINKLADVVACRLPQGVPLRRQIFLSSTPRRATSCKPHTHDDVFSASAVKSPSNAFNLVGRWLLLAETCSRRPSRKRPRVGLLSLAAPADCARANPTGDFAAKNTNRAATCSRTRWAWTAAARWQQHGDSVGGGSATA